MNQLSLFAGVGAFELAATENGIETILSCENDKYCCQILRKRFKDTEIYEKDIRELESAYIRDKYGTPDIITAGFPCQSFSIAGKRQGFKDVTRGTLFFEVARLASELHPTYIILENVKGLFSDQNGWTFGVIISRLGELGYDAEWQLLNSKDFGVPQNRERVFIIGHLRGKRTKQIFPIRKQIQKHNEIKKSTKTSIVRTLSGGGNSGGNHSGMTMLKIHSMFPRSSKTGKGGTGHLSKNDGTVYCLDTGNCQAIEIGTLRTHNDGKGFRKMKSGLSPSLVSRAREDGSGQAITNINGRIRRLTPLECERLQSFPNDWTEGQSDTQRYKQMGNSITVNVLREIYKKLTKNNIERTPLLML